MNFVRPFSPATPGLLAEDDVLPALCAWLSAGKRVCLITLVSIEGGSPRPIGAQMAVSEDGNYAGYLSGGCLEQAIALEAKALIAKGQSGLVRYGRGSPYFDIRLPCGSGLDVYFDCSVTPAAGASVAALRRERKPFALVSDLTGEATCLVREGVGFDGGSCRDQNIFTRVYLPLPRMVLFGAGPSVAALCRVAQAVGMDVSVWAGDEPTRAALDALGQAHFATPSVTPELVDALDAYSAVVLAFHEHGQEPAILDRVLSSPCFYIGVLGNHAVHRERLRRLETDGHSAAELARMRAPIGVIPQAKSQATLALGVMTEILMEAKLRRFVA